MKRKLWAFLLLIFYFNSLLLLRPGNEVDAEFKWIQYFGVGTLFINWVLSLVGWSIAMSRVFKLGTLGWPASFALSLSFYSMLVAILGCLGLLGAGSGLFFILMVAVGLILFSQFLEIKNPFQSLRTYYSSAEYRPLIWIFTFVLVACVLDPLLRAQIPWEASDPLFYQLLSPRLWFEQGLISFDAHAPLTLQASYWEYLHLWPFELISQGSGRGLIEVQIFAQLVHVMSMLACAALFERLCRVVLKIRPEVTLLCIISILCNRALLKFTFQAKNDWGASFWVLAGCSLLFLFDSGESERDSFKTRRSIVAGALVGMGVGAKFLHLPFAIVIVVANSLQIYFHRKTFELKQLFVFSAAFFVTALPYFLRNIIFTGDPLYPYYTRLFPTHIPLSLGLSTLIGSYEHASATRSFQYFIDLYRHIFTFDFSYYFIPFVFLSVIGFRKRPSWFPILLSALFNVVVFTTLGTHTEVRHLGCPILLFSALSPLGVDYFLNQLTARWMRLAPLRPVAWVSFMLGVVYFSSGIFVKGIDGDGNFWDFLAYWRQSPPANIYVVKRHLNGIQKAWFRANAPEGTHIAYAIESQFYYLPRLEVSSLELSSEFNDLMEKDPIDIPFLLKELNARGYKYLADSYPGPGPTLPPLLTSYLKDKQCLVAFQTKNTRITDLEKAAHLVDEKCP